MAVSGTDLPRLIGERYALEACIGRGGMGEVWRARHVALGSYFAIKFLHGALASEERTRKRFLKEAQLTAQLKTRHAVQVFDYGVTQDGIPYLVMELLDGETLDQRIARIGPLEPADAVRILRLAARALDRAHQIGIIHRDFKPENVFVLEDEEGVETVKVVDFGIAKLVGELETDKILLDALPEGKEALSTFTRTATLVGTPYYMGPEQIDPSSDLGPSADLWALGVVAFECLTGQRPFDAEDLRDLFASIQKSTHRRASDLVPELPAAFDTWFEKACATDAADRFKTGHVAIAALANALGVPIESEQPGARGAPVHGVGSVSDPPTGDFTPVPAAMTSPPKGIASGVYTPSGQAIPSRPPSPTGAPGRLRTATAWLRQHPRLASGLVGVGTACLVAFAAIVGARRMTSAVVPEMAPASSGSPRWIGGPEPQLVLPVGETAPAVPEPSARSEPGDEKRGAAREPNAKRSKAAASASARPAASAPEPPTSPPTAPPADPGSAFKLPPLGL